MIKPAYSVSFLLSINIFIWQNVLYFLDTPRNVCILHTSFLFLHMDSFVFIYDIKKSFIYVIFLHIKCRPLYRCNKYCLTLSNMWDNNNFNILKPAGHVMHQQFNIQQLYALPTLYLCVLYLSENKQRLVPLTA